MNDFFIKRKQKKIEIVARPGVVLAAPPPPEEEVATGLEDLTALFEVMC